MKTKEIDILDILLILAKHKKFIFFTTLIVSIIAVIYSLLATQYWISTATILPSSDKNDSFSISSSFLGGFASSMLGGEQSNAYTLTGIMQSRTFSLDVVKKFNLIEYFEIEEPDTLISYEAAIKSLIENVVDFGINEENGFLSIGVETKDKYFSADIANYYWMKLDEYNKSVRMTKGKQQREFIEKRLVEVKESIDILSNTLNEFQKKYNTIDLEEQAKSVVSLYSDLVSEKITNEIELEFSKQFFSEANQKIENLEIRNDILNNKIKEIERNSGKLKPKYILSIDDIPDISLEYTQIVLNLEIQQKIYEYLYPQYESAKIDELKDLPTIEVIDKAVPAGLRSKPKRARFCVIMFFIALLISSIYCFAYEMFRFYLNNHKTRWDKVKKYCGK
jgi:capsule polysaccharide export protein KpsE/RkpR